MTTTIATYSYQQPHFQEINNDDEEEISITEIESETEIEVQPEQDTVINKKPFRCTMESCTAAFAKKNHLTSHIKTHTGEKPYKCTFEECNSAFAQKGHLTTHMRT